MTMLSPSASVSDLPLPTADSRSGLATEPVIHRIWPSATVAFGLGLSAAWTCLLGYGLFKLIALTI